MVIRHIVIRLTPGSGRPPLITEWCDEDGSRDTRRYICHKETPGVLRRAWISLCLVLSIRLCSWIWNQIARANVLKRETIIIALCLS